jgi:hypothetical protein
MPAKLREPKDRRPVFTDELLDLFSELEVWPLRRRHGTEWNAKSKRLAGLLGLSSEWWTCQHVNDTEPPCGPPDGAARTNWVTCREMRQRLLEAAQRQ